MANSRGAVRRRVLWALRDGILVRSSNCERCGEPPSGRGPGGQALHAHHHNGYDEAYVLDVQWLCTSCHVTIHAHPRGLGKLTPQRRSEIAHRAGAEYVANHTPEQRSAVSRRGWVTRKMNIARLAERGVP